MTGGTSLSYTDDMTNRTASTSQTLAIAQLTGISHSLIEQDGETFCNWFTDEVIEGFRMLPSGNLRYGNRLIIHQDGSTDPIL